MLAIVESSGGYMFIMNCFLYLFSVFEIFHDTKLVNKNPNSNGNIIIKIDPKCVERRGWEKKLTYILGLAEA